MPTAPPTAVNGAATIFVVRDLQRSLAFYRDVLGFTVAFTYGQPPWYAGVERGKLIVHLLHASHTNRQPGQGALYAFVDDVDALFDEFKANHADLPKEPQDYPYGMRDFDLDDPDGNKVNFGSESKTDTK